MQTQFVDTNLPSEETPSIAIRHGQSAFIRFVKKGRHRINRFLSRYSLVGDTPTYDPAIFPWLEGLNACAPAITEELHEILRHRAAIPPFRDFAPGHERIAPGADDWRSFFFYGYGYPVAENLARCPATAQALAKVPNLVSAIYSVVGAGAHIRRHRGVSKAIMTVHVPLIVPTDAEKCRMEVGDRLVVWQLGTPVIIDDTYFHEVWNQSNQLRVVLLLQVRRPMRQPGKAVADAIVWFVRNSSFVQRARKNLDYWEHAFAKAERGI